VYSDFDRSIGGDYLDPASGLVCGNAAELHRRLDDWSGLERAFNLFRREYLLHNGGVDDRYVIDQLEDTLGIAPATAASKLAS
jgi:hypothetical protein